MNGRVAAPDPPTAELRAVVDEVTRLARDHRDAADIERLRAALERALDLLLTTAVDPHSDADAVRRSIALRDAVASHLRVVDELSDASARPERRVHLLLRAADLFDRDDRH